jgi:hypothetical protein
MLHAPAPSNLALERIVYYVDRPWLQVILADLV